MASPFKKIASLTIPLLIGIGLIYYQYTSLTDEQLETLAKVKGTTPQQELDKIVNIAPKATGLPPPPAKNNTMLYVGGGIVVAGLAYVAFK